MACDPKKIYTDLEVKGKSTVDEDLSVVGTILSYAELWLSGTKKEDGTTTTVNVDVVTFQYKNIDYYNVFRSDTSGELLSAEIRQGVFVSGMEDAGTLIEKIDYV